MKIAALDAGSHSFHLIVAEVEEVGKMSKPGGIRVVERAKEMVRVGERTLLTRVIPDDGFRRGLSALARLRAVSDEHRPDALVAVATAAIREAANGGAFVVAAREQAGIDLRVVSGDEEARLVYLGARQALDLSGGRRVALFDLGGGSLEAVVADERRILFSRSLPLGGLRLAESWLVGDPPDPRELAAMRTAVSAQLAPIAREMARVGFDFVALVGGTANAIRDILVARSGLKRSQHTEIALADLRALERELAVLDSRDREQVEGLNPFRVDTIVPGTTVLRIAMEAARLPTATFCRSSIRHGIIADYIDRLATPEARAPRTAAQGA